MEESKKAGWNIIFIFFKGLFNIIKQVIQIIIYNRKIKQ